MKRYCIKKYNKCFRVTLRERVPQETFLVILRRVRRGIYARINTLATIYRRQAWEDTPLLKSITTYNIM